MNRKTFIKSLGVLAGIVGLPMNLLANEDELIIRRINHKTSAPILFDLDEPIFIKKGQILRYIITNHGKIRRIDSSPTFDWFAKSIGFYEYELSSDCHIESIQIIDSRGLVIKKYKVVEKRHPKYA